MIKNLDYFDLKEGDDNETVIKKVTDKLGVSIDQMKEAISLAVQTKASDIALDIFNIAPFGDYSKLLEDSDSIVDFLKTEAYKPEHWELECFNLEKSNLIKFIFVCNAIDDGDLLEGFVFVNEAGKIKHAFAQAK
jgi:hypothetical protein